MRRRIASTASSAMPPAAWRRPARRGDRPPGRRRPRSRGRPARRPTAGGTPRARGAKVSGEGDQYHDHMWASIARGVPGTPSPVRLDAVTDLIARVSAPIAGAAASLADGVSPDVALERPGDASHGDFATTVALRLAPILRRSPRQIAEEIASRIRDGTRLRGGRGGGRRLRQRPARAGVVPRRRRRDRRGRRRLRRRPAGRAPQRAGRAGVRQPDRRRDGRLGPQRRLRRQRRAAGRVRRPRGRARVLLQRRRRPGGASSAPRSAPKRRGERCPRTATRAPSSTSSRRCSTLDPDASIEEWTAAAVPLDVRAHQGQPRAAPHPRRHLVLRSASCTPRAPSTGRSARPAPPATCTRRTARRGSRRRSSATTRTAC